MAVANRNDSQVAREEFLSFRLGDEEYAIDILKVQEIRAQESVTRIANAPAFLKGVINLRGTIVPIMDLRARFGMPAVALDHLTVMIILNVAGRLVGIVVDAVSDVLALHPDQVRPAPEMAAGIGNGAIRGMATVAERLLILVDIEALVSS